MKEKRIFIIDDDESILASLKTYFRIKGFIVETYPSAVLFLEEKSKNTEIEYGCIVSDINMEGLTGLDLQDLLLESKSMQLLPIIFITGHANVEIAIKAMKLGARDFLSKPFDTWALFEKVEKALIDNKERFDVCKRISNLTQKEKRVFDEIVKGLKNKEICDSLHISMGTVESHRSKIMKKMEAKSLAELVKMYALTKQQ